MQVIVNDFLIAENDAYLVMTRQLYTYCICTQKLFKIVHDGVSNMHGLLLRTMYLENCRVLIQTHIVNSRTAQCQAGVHARVHHQASFVMELIDLNFSFTNTNSCFNILPTNYLTVWSYAHE